jgi:hypothetical protein
LKHIHHKVVSIINKISSDQIKKLENNRKMLEIVIKNEAGVEGD